MLRVVNARERTVSGVYTWLQHSRQAADGHDET
jgi:hypothetical protein